MNREYFSQENMLAVPLCAAFPLLIGYLKDNKKKEALPEPWQKVVFLYRKGYSYTTLGQYERAFQTYLELLRLVLQHSSNTTKEKLDDLLHGFYRFFLFLGQKLLEDGSYALSLHYCSQMLEYFPKDSRLLKLIVKSQMALGFSHWEKVENNLKLLIKIEPQELRNYQNLGRFYESDPTTLGQAIKSYRKALSFCRHELDRAWFYQRILRLAPYDQKGWHRLGLLYLSRGMYIEAENCLEQAYRLGPGLSVTLDFVTTLIHLNKLERAEELLQQLEATFRQEKDNGEELLKSCFLMARVCEGKEYWCTARVLYSYCAQEAAGKPLAAASRQGIIRSYLEEGRLERAEELLLNSYQEEQDKEQSSYLGLIFELIDSLEKNGFIEKARDWRRKLTANNPAVFQQKNILLSQNKIFWRRYEVLEFLGTGTLGDTILCQERYKGGKVVVKEFKGEVFSPLLLRRLHNYLEMLKGLNIKQLAVFLEGAFWGENYLAVWEYLPDGNLRQHLR
ncbi:MAG: tetratricopeptide repeat protein, partial [Firmicutes bacterium]|nr:tetratricopeptide repeat protein [Bacillota bacterium]